MDIEIGLAVCIVLLVVLVGVALALNPKPTQHGKGVPDQVTLQQLKSMTPDQVTLQQLKSMTPVQISTLNVARVSDLVSQYVENMHGIPQFPELRNQLTTDQYNAFYRLYTDGKVY